MGGKKTLDPPQITYPEMSQQEKDIMAKQSDLLTQLASQSNSAFTEGSTDRATALTMLNQLKSANPNQLSDAENTMLDNISKQYYQNASDNYNSSVDKQIFDQNRNDSIAGLARRGVLDSSVAQTTLGQQESQRQAILQAMSSDAALKRLTMGQDLLSSNKNTQQNLINILSGQGNQLTNTATNMTSNATTAAGQLSQQLANERAGQYNTQVQNAQLAYQSALANKKNMGGMGALAGAGIGALLAIPTGGMSLAAGAALGGTLGGSAGSMISY